MVQTRRQHKIAQKQPKMHGRRWLNGARKSVPLPPPNPLRAMKGMKQPRGQHEQVPYADSNKHIPLGKHENGYHPIKITLSEGHKRKLKKLQAIRLHRDSIEGARHGQGRDVLYITKEQYKRINNRKRKRGIQFTLSPHQLHYNRLHGSGLFSSFKDLVRSGYNKIKDSGLAEKAASAAGNLALQQGKKLALNKLEGRQGAAAGAARQLLGGKGLSKSEIDKGMQDALNAHLARGFSGGKLKGKGLFDILGSLF